MAWHYIPSYNAAMCGSLSGQGKRVNREKDLKINKSNLLLAFVLLFFWVTIHDY